VLNLYTDRATAQIFIVTRLGTRETDDLWQKREAVVAMLHNVVKHVYVFLLYKILNLSPFTDNT